ncbi:MAG: exo-alpha-sialidase [Verrucomicrobia bacterium]|nr:exo-alpha-sialidase [Verrucomicrobiota bacterium]
MRHIFISTALVLLTCFHVSGQTVKANNSSIRKVEDIVIYNDAKYYSAFPSIVRRANGELIVAFRRAPNWRALGTKGYTHTDPNSYLVLVRSRDNGKTWSKDPETIYAHPFGGSQDPCMLQLKDKSILCASYAWALPKPEVVAKLKQPVFPAGAGFIFMGGYIMRSEDGGKNWDGPILPPSVPSEKRLDIFGETLPAYNRGAMCQGKDGRVFWIVAAQNLETKQTENHLMISSDNGKTWEYSCPVAQDEKVTFNEASIYETPKGDLVGFLRTANFNDHTVVVRSRDGGKSFEKWEDSGFKGHPHYALRLPDKRVLLVYGYRHQPSGIRARVLDAECTNFKTAEEIILRADGGGFDLGYPWATMISKDRALVVYYFNQNDGPRHIAGTVLSVK